ncbi:MAG: hypothetical protein O2798_11425 [Chloroflexi bacterium]|nr:hypothetical protein [Chloroflexota bacterium]MDA1241431.1 hypothetical protein [Chloroflexota bacterium]
MNDIQDIYNAIIIRGRRSNPTYAEVKRDARADLLNRADLSFGVRI